jgi:hypothetical protein
VLAYGEGVSAVDFLIRTYGKAALVKLVRSYSGGVSDDEAFRAALGTGTLANGPDVAGFQAAWLADIGAAAPNAYGPAPAPAGPLPSDWSAALASPGIDGSPGTPSGALTPAGSSPASAASSATTAAGGTAAVPAIIGLVALAGLGLLLAARSRRRSTGGEA